MAHGGDGAGIRQRGAGVAHYPMETRGEVVRGMAGPTLRPYEQYTFARPRPSSDLYALSDRLIAQDVAAIVRTEGPIHADLLYYRMAKLYSIERAGGEVRRVVDRALREATRSGEVVRQGRFYLPGGMERAEPRLAGPRTVEQIAPEELQDTVLLVLRNDAALAQPDLVRGVARALGFQRTGAALNAGITAAIEALVAAGHITHRDGLLVPFE